MNYKILENFIDTSLCYDLIKDADTFSGNDHIQVLNNRLLLPSSSLSFFRLYSSISKYIKQIMDWKFSYIYGELIN